jgi:hypothetical protein
LLGARQNDRIERRFNVQTHQEEWYVNGERRTLEPSPTPRAREAYPRQPQWEWARESPAIPNSIRDAAALFSNNPYLTARAEPMSESESLYTRIVNAVDRVQQSGLTPRRIVLRSNADALLGEHISVRSRTRRIPRVLPAGFDERNCDEIVVDQDAADFSPYESYSVRRLFGCDVILDDDMQEDFQIVIGGM